MTIVTFFLGFVLVAAGAGGLVASFDLLPTELGLLYASAARCVSGGGVTVAIGALIRRLDVIATARRSLQNRDSGKACRRRRRKPSRRPNSRRRAAEEAAEPAPADEPAAIEEEPDALAEDDFGQ